MTCMGCTGKVKPRDNILNSFNQSESCLSMTYLWCVDSKA